MASSSSSSDIGDSLDELSCPVCLELYKEPIALPCGHSFCRVCIEKSWESRGEDTGCVCPNCREVFQQKPKLKKNVIIANLVEKIKLKKREVGLGVDVRGIEHGDLKVKEGMKSGGTDSYCEVCKREAAKRCVPCQILCCEQHVKAHKQKGHKLVDPGVKIEELRCIDHEKPILLYCKDDGSLICIMCMGGQHQDHKVVPVEIAHVELKGVLAAKCPDVSESIQIAASQLQQVQEEEEQTKGSKDLLKRLETMSDFKSVKTTPLTALDFSKEEKNLDVLIKLNKNFLEKIQKELVEHLEMVELDRNNLRSVYGRTLSLDPNSVHRGIKISCDLRTATLTGADEPYPEHPDRFDCSYQVVSSESFSSGRHYWEVDVSSSSWCRIGICLNSMRRKGRGSGLGMNPQSWCLYIDNNTYYTLHNNQCTPLSMSGDPERFGFFLDCEAGELTCFEDSRVLHVFRGNFMDPVKPAIGVYIPVGDSVRFL